MQQRFSFGTGVILALAGIGFSVFGIMESEFKPAAVGLILILGAAVFAMLYMGTRRVEREE